MHKKTRVLLICKKRVDSYGIPIGLINSATFVVRALNANGIEAKLVSVNDNNAIHKEVTDYKPTHVMIEALWVVPAKFDELLQLHPDKQWLVRIHSKTPFLSMEGIAMEWIEKYADLGKKYSNFIMAPNSYSLHDDLKNALGIKSVTLPNIYYPDCKERCIEERKIGKEINVGCFGAIRPLKNHLIQALAAIALAKELKKKLKFHINANRIEQKGDDILKNLRALANAGEMELIEHPWSPHGEFLSIVSKMDVGMQVSLSESFNIVAADFVFMGVPIIVSKDVNWMPDYAKADANDMSDIVDKLKDGLDGGWWFSKMTTLNRKALQEYNENSLKAWKRFLK